MDFFQTNLGIFLTVLGQTLLVLGFVMISLLLLVYGDRKIWGAVQMRRGPNVVGPWGILQTIADALKYVVKEVVVPAGADKKELHRSHFAAWKLGTKGLYYLRTETSQRAENVSEKIARDQLKDFETQTIEAQSQDECVACQG